MKTPRKRLIPFFLPLLGCPGRCVFCDQHSISGKPSAPDPAEVAAALERLQTVPVEERPDLAYYGGSFTCLPRKQQQAWLELARPHLERGALGGVRISTRADAVDAETCAFLRQQGVVTVELGVQSFDDRVLLASRRGCTAKAARQGCRAVRDSGLELGIQLMTGLPGVSPEDAPDTCRRSLREALSFSPGLLRIYPTLVIRGTELAALYEQGLYRPQSLPDAVTLCADLLEQAEAAGVPVQRLGLNPTPSLEASLIAGPYHPAFGGLVREEVFFRRAKDALPDRAEARTLLVSPPDLALAYGQQRRNYQRLNALRPGLVIRTDAGLSPGQIGWE